jgi:phosphoribosylformimino-5-aminoimidazole carboxamide ribonucleotide (ProFAR) isomerase
MKSLEFLPAVDIKSGQVNQGIESVINQYQGSPQEVISEFISAGCTWVHLVDLDLAYSSGNNFDLISGLINSTKVNTQLSGGISNQKNLDLSLSTNAKWINLSTSALVNFDWVVSVMKAYSKRVCISLDLTDEVLIARGSGLVVGDLWQNLQKLESIGCLRYVVTDNKSDGAMIGPNFGLLAKIQQITSASIISSGGVASISDLQKLRQLGIDGVVVGKALYAGQINLIEALDTCYK